jgi:hypothetical protein
VQVRAADGRTVTVGRRWLPWRPRPREFDAAGDFFGDLGGDDLQGVVLSIVLGLVLALLAPLILTVVVLAGEVLLLLLLLPLVALARVLLGRPWLVQARHDGSLLGVEPVRGWFASGARIREIATAYERGGGDPFVG